MRKVSERRFSQMFKRALGRQFPRALHLFRTFGDGCSAEMVGILTTAIEHNKVSRALDTLERHVPLSLAHPLKLTEQEAVRVYQNTRHKLTSLHAHLHLKSLN